MIKELLTVKDWLEKHPGKISAFKPESPFACHLTIFVYDEEIKAVNLPLQLNQNGIALACTNQDKAKIKEEEAKETANSAFSILDKWGERGTNIILLKEGEIDIHKIQGNW